MNRDSRGEGRLTFWLGVIVTAGFFWVNIAGFVDTETGSALGCGHNWPLCNGSVIPSIWGLHTLIEFLHRAIVGIVVMLLLLFASLALWKYRQWREIKILVGLSLFFTVLQSFLGALGVLLPHDPPAVLAVHLGVSLMALNSVFLSTVVIGQIRKHSLRLIHGGQRTGLRSLRTPLADGRLRRWTWVTAIYTFFAMYVGAFVSSTGTGGMFRGWPLPTESMQTGYVLILDVLHRGLAMGVLLFLIRLTLLTYRLRDTHPALYRASTVALILVCMQVVSGMLLIETHLSIGAFLSHVSILSCLFATLCYLCLQVTPEASRNHRKPQSHRHSSPKGLL